MIGYIIASVSTVSVVQTVINCGLLFIFTKIIINTIIENMPKNTASLEEV